MYHIGMIQHIIYPDRNGVVSSDLSVQAVVRMWDSNLLILGVDKKISKKARKGDYVLADYTPLAADSRHRKLTVIKLLPESEGSKIWGEFQDEMERRKVIMQQHTEGNQQRYYR